MIFIEAMKEEVNAFTKLKLILLLFFTVAMLVFFFYNIPGTIIYLFNLLANSIWFALLSVTGFIALWVYLAFSWLPERGYENLGFFLFFPGGAILVGIIFVLVSKF